MSSTPMISVLIPIFNGEKFLTQSLESIKNQTFIDFEVLLIDDGSTDGSMSILNEFAHSDNRVKVISKTNSGLTDTLNRGLLECRGDWIARMDQDDIASPKRFELQLKKIESDEAIVLVGSDFVTLDEQTRKTKRYKIPSTHEQMVKRLERLRGFFPHSSALIHAETIRRIGGYDPLAFFNEDWDLWLRLSECGKIGSVSEPLVIIRKHPLQMTQNSGLIMPQGEAFISSTVHLLKRQSTATSVKFDLDREQIRNLVQVTKGYKRFCRIVLLQHLIRSTMPNRCRWMTVFQTIIRLDEIVYLFSYRFYGTSGPKLIARKLLKEMN